MMYVLHLSGLCVIKVAIVNKAANKGYTHFMNWYKSANHSQTANLAR